MSTAHNLRKFHVVSLINTHMPMQMREHAHMYTCIYAHTDTHTDTHAHTHTHTLHSQCNITFKNTGISL